MGGGGGASYPGALGQNMLGLVSSPEQSGGSGTKTRGGSCAKMIGPPWRAGVDYRAFY